MNRLSMVADFEKARNFHVKLKSFFSLLPSKRKAFFIDQGTQFAWDEALHSVFFF